MRGDITEMRKNLVNNLLSILEIYEVLPTENIARCDFSLNTNHIDVFENESNLSLIYDKKLLEEKEKHILEDNVEELRKLSQLETMLFIYDKITKRITFISSRLVEEANNLLKDIGFELSDNFKIYDSENQVITFEVKAIKVKELVHS